MKTDENEFFRQATLLITGSLDLKTILDDFSTFLKSFMPVSGINISLYDPDLNIGRLLEGIAPDNVLLPDGNTHIIPDEYWQFLLKNWTGPQWVRIVNGVASDDPEWQELLFHLVGPGYSFLMMDLKLNNKRMGVLLLFAEGENQYTKAHAHLISLLHDPFAGALHNFLAHEEIVRLKDMLADENRQMQKQITQMARDTLIGSELGLKPVMDLVRQVAPLNSPVLLLGETGVGKELIADTIHFSSRRADNPFIKINCGAIPENLIDSELFGHEKGAFTGAVSGRRGCFERANSGTIFLDEVGELPLSAQVRLLRVLQQFEIERVGGVETIPVDVRIISATNRNLEEMVRKGQFREDLWFRLNVVPIIIPPLRQRPEDIPGLVNHFLDQKYSEMKIKEKPKLEPGTVNSLLAYHWPGNVRELENTVVRALIDYQLNQSQNPLTFGRALTGSKPDSFLQVSTQDESIRPLDEVIASHIRRTVAYTDGKIGGKNGAAQLLAVHPNTLRARMRKLKIPFGKQKQGSNGVI